MSEEIVDTNPDITPIGHHNMVCEKVLKKLADSGKPYYLFTFSVAFDGAIKKHIEARQPWMAGDLIVALGGKPGEKSGTFIWDREKCVGKEITADVIHEPDFKDKTKMRAKITNPAESIPF